MFMINELSKAKTVATKFDLYTIASSLDSNKIRRFSLVSPFCENASLKNISKLPFSNISVIAFEFLFFSKLNAVTT